MSDYFKRTSDGLYDRHRYRMVFNSFPPIEVESYEEVIEIHQQFIGSNEVKTVEVLDRKVKKSKPKGF